MERDERDDWGHTPGRVMRYLDEHGYYPWWYLGQYELPEILSMVALVLGIAVMAVSLVALIGMM